MALFWIEVVLLAYFIYVALYTITFSLAGNLYKLPFISSSIKNESKFVIFIPAYKEDAVITQVAQAALNQNYASSLYDIIVVADSLQAQTLEKLRKLPIRVIEVAFEKSTKVKALKKAFEQVNSDYHYAVILDADNVMHEDFIKTLNNLHNQGYDAIQGRRAAKNMGNALSLLDGLSEEINNHILGKGSTTLRLSASLKGSGMSFRYDLLKKHLSQMDSIGGFDRELELRLVDDGKRVLYAHNAIIFDEKVEKPEVFENQRKRWISSQYYYLKAYFFSGITHLLKGHVAYFNSTVLRNIQLPRLLNLGLILLFTIVSTTLSFWFSTLYLEWVIVMTITFIGTLMAIPKSYYGKPLLKAVLSLPGIFAKMLLLLFKLKGANKKFIHTPHTSTDEHDTN